MEAEQRVPRLAPGVEIAPERAGAASVTVSVPPERYFEVSPAAARLLRAIDGQRTLDEIARAIAADGLRPTAAQLADVIDRTLVPRGLVHFGAAPAPGEAPRSRLWLRVTLIPAPLVNAISSGLPDKLCRKITALLRQS